MISTHIFVAKEILLTQPRQAQACCKGILTPKLKMVVELFGGLIFEFSQAQTTLSLDGSMKLDKARSQKSAGVGHPWDKALLF